MKHIFIALAALTLLACEKPAENPAAETAAQTGGQTTQAETAEAPTAPATSGESAHEEAEKKATLAEDIKAGETKLFGAPFTIIEPPITLAAAIEKSAATPVKIDATIEKACKAKGCWFTLTAEGISMPVRVKMKDYGFFVPRNSDGSRAIVEGVLTMREMPVDEAKHYAQDEGKTGDEITEPTKTYEIMATSVEVYAPAS
jgi:hypothetical protein